MAENTKRLARTALDKLEQLMGVLNEGRRRGKYDIITNNNPLVTRWKRKKIKDSETIAIDYFLGSIGAIVVQKKIVANIDEVQKVHDAVADALKMLENIQ